MRIIAAPSSLNLRQTFPRRINYRMRAYWREQVNAGLQGWANATVVDRSASTAHAPSTAAAATASPSAAQASDD